LKDFSNSSISNAKILLDIAKGIKDKYYPGIESKMYIINVGFFTKGLLKFFLDDSMEVLGSDYKKIIEKVIDFKYMPRDLKGEVDKEIY